MEKRKWKMMAIMLAVVMIIPITMASSDIMPPEYKEIGQGVYEKTEREIVDVNEMRNEIDFLKGMKMELETTDDYYNGCVELCEKSCRIEVESEIDAIGNTIDSLETEIARIESGLPKEDKL